MVTKEEWQQWKQEPVTQRLIDLLMQARDTAFMDLVGMQGQVGDIPRGAGIAYEDMLNVIKTGEDIWTDVGG